MKEVDAKQIKVDLSAYQYFREHAGERFDGEVWYKGTIDHVVTLMQEYAQWREENPVNGNQSTPANEARDYTDIYEAKETHALNKVNEAKEVESVEQAAERHGAIYYKKEKPANTYTYHEGFKDGAKWMAHSGIKNNIIGKHKTAEEIIIEVAEINLRSLPIHEVSLKIAIESAQIYAAQFTPIEQGKRMVSVDEVVELIRIYPHLSLSSTHELINQINNLNKA